MKRLQWNHDEVAAVIRSGVDLLLKQPGLTHRDVLMKAQSVLPADRRRPDFSVWAIFRRLSKMLTDRLELEQRLHRAEAHTPSSPAAPIPLPKFDHAMIAFGHALAKEIAEQVGERMETIFKNQSAAAAAKPKNGNGTALTVAEERVIDRVVDRAPVVPAPAPITSSKPSAPSHQAKAMIVGLENAQVNHVRHKFPSMDLRFVGAKTPQHQLQELSRTCDAAYVMSRHCRLGEIKAWLECDVVAISGSVSMLAREIEVRFPRH